MGRKQDGTVLIGVGAANGRHVVGVAGDGEQVGEALGGRVGVAVRIGDDKVDEVEPQLADVGRALLHRHRTLAGRRVRIAEARIAPVRVVARDRRSARRHQHCRATNTHTHKHTVNHPQLLIPSMDCTKSYEPSIN